MNRNDRTIASFTGLGHGIFHGFELVIPIFVPIWLAAFDASPTTLGIAVGAGYAIIGIFAPIAGILADWFGSKRLVLVSVGGMGVGFGALSISSSVVELTVLLLVWGTAASLYHPAGLSVISRSAEKRGTVLAVHGAGGNIGTVAIPSAAALLLVVFDWRIVVLLLAVPAVICVITGFVLDVELTDDPVDPTRGDGLARGSLPSEIVSSFRNSIEIFTLSFMLVLAIQGVWGIYYRGIFTFLPDVLTNLPIFETVSVGDFEIAAGQIAYAGLLLIGVFGQYAGGLISDRMTPEVAMVGTCSTLMIASLFFVPASGTGVVPLAAICAIIGFFLYSFGPIGQSMVAKYTPAEKHGVSFGYVYLAAFGVGALGAPIAGVALDLGGVPALFVTLAVLVGVCTAIGLGLFMDFGGVEILPDRGS